MATPPIFTAGQVLTAAQMNAIGLWLVKSQTIGTTVSSVTVNDAFSADFDNYLITINNGAGSAGADITLKFGSVVTGYYHAIVGSNWGATPVSAGNNNDTSLRYNGNIDTTNGYTSRIEVNSPFLSKQTSVRSSIVTTNGAYNTLGMLNTTQSFTSFIIAPSSGTLTGGTIRVYGYTI